MMHKKTAENAGGMRPDGPPKDAGKGRTGKASGGTTDGWRAEILGEGPRRQKGGFAAFWRNPKTRLGAICLAWLLCVGVLVTAIVQIRSAQQMYKESADEYNALREAYSEIGGPGGEKPEDPAVINPDYTGWIEIPGTSVSYPVVRGKDNAKYLNTSFAGNANAAGALFMDYRNTAGFASRNTIIYGHNMKNGTMFGQLANYLDDDFLRKNPTITVAAEGKTYTYRIFSARVTDAWDAAYQLDFADDAAFAAFAEGLGAPAGTAHLLTLSTCTNGPDEERILVHAALEE